MEMEGIIVLRPIHHWVLTWGMLADQILQAIVEEVQEETILELEDE
jgi:hypothetical protein